MMAVTCFAAALLDHTLLVRGSQDALLPSLTFQCNRPYRAEAGINALADAFSALTMYSFGAERMQLSGSRLLHVYATM